LFVERFMAREVRYWVTDRQTDRQTHTTTRVTLAAHAHRGFVTRKLVPPKSGPPGTSAAEKLAPPGPSTAEK
jgi:hypothetical protein